MSESIDEEIRVLRELYWSARDPDGRGFAPLADAYRRKGELDEAYALTRDGLKRLPDFATGHLVAAWVARDRTDLLEARKHLDHVLKLDSRNVTALAERAEIRWSSGDREGALTDLRTVLELEPARNEVRDRLQALEVVGDASPPADVGGDLVRQEGSENPGASNASHESFGKVGVEESDASRLDLANDPDPAGDPDEVAWPVYTRTMGEIYTRQGLNEHALAVYEHLAAQHPDDAELKERLMEIRARLDKSPPLEKSPPEELSSTRSIGRYLEDLLAWEPGAVPIESLAPAAGAGAEEGMANDHSAPDGPDDELDDFQSWLESVRP